uniref:Hook microtubule tethering protein 2 n=1 Tax=Sphenodon punctatus TaxID=8508 RepID=A0A8D0FZ35_SPHPU
FRTCHAPSCCLSLSPQLQTFPVPAQSVTAQDLASGVTIAQVLHRIDPAWFNETWLLRIKDDTGDNWRLKLSNLKKILQSVVEYSQDVLGHQVPEQLLPDVGLIGEFSDAAELAKLLQLVLGCAIGCEKKQDHIQQIMTLEESVQHAVMGAIQELMTKDSADTLTSETYGNFDSQSRKYYFLSEDPEETESMSQRCQELEQQVSLLAEEKNTLVQENRSLREQKSRLESDATGLTGKKLLLFQSQIEQLQEENFRLESSRDDLRGRCEELVREAQELQHRNEELTSLAEEAQALKDEMDVLRWREGSWDSWVPSKAVLGSLQRQRLGCQTVSQALVSPFAPQVHELHSKHSDEALKAEKWQFEFRNLKEKFEALAKEKERLMEERDSLREANEELRCVQVQQKCLSQADTVLEETASSVDNLAAEIMPAELKETIVRLQHENKMLCAQEAAYQQRQTELQGLLEESNRANHGLEAQQRLGQQQVEELKVQVEELQRALQEQGSKAEDVSRVEGWEKLHEAHAELQKKREYIDALEPKVDSSTARRIDELQQSLKKKDEDMRAMEERYKTYMDKACRVIKTLDPKQPPLAPAPEIQALKNQLQEKEVKLTHLETDFEKSKSQREQEERLIISAWYNMGMALHQRITEDRPAAPASTQSFLAQQRLAANS